ncbi:MAG: hypothetical protein QJR12_05235 [Mycobacterium sp.]|uniref:hypothetical protein n=1 Tax=Mycobacterium sp. TaxID=1785 RepID=UPI00262A08EA|nr:hypothetical protein [Mycobacterium sp.]MDI3313693.1 hypothetical protein [Mycobacterium sp.]
MRNYRGTTVDIPEADVGDVLVRLGRAAAKLRKMPCQNAFTAAAYLEAHQLLEQLNRLSDVGCCGQKHDIKPLRGQAKDNP